MSSNDNVELYVNRVTKAQRVAIKMITDKLDAELNDVATDDARIRGYADAPWIYWSQRINFIASLFWKPLGQSHFYDHLPRIKWRVLMVRIAVNAILALSASIDAEIAETEGKDRDANNW